MHHAKGSLVARTVPAVAALTGMPQVLAFLPALMLAAYWTGGELALVTAALFLPLVVAVRYGRNADKRSRDSGRDPATGLPKRQAAVQHLDAALAEHGMSGKTTAALAIAIEGYDDLVGLVGQHAANTAMRRIGDRLRAAVRDSDLVAQLGNTQFCVALGSMRRADLEALLQIAARLQEAVREPVSIDATRIHLTSSIGFCLKDSSPVASGEAMLAAAETAMREAQSRGPGAIRAFSGAIQSPAPVGQALCEAVAAALEAGRIQPWFQPQISTDTGRLTGFEALARWHRGNGEVLSAAEFLPAISAAGLSERLSEVILSATLTALRSWDNAGIEVPQVGVNFSTDDLRNPALADRIQWELDRFGLSPQRLAVEVLETVISGQDDEVIVRNLAALAAAGCGIDLDDFGTGHASIAAIRRFPVRRLKIDRSFVTRVDQDRDQQDIVAAILSMADRLKLETVAEGVETPGEHAMLAQLGCSSVQGFGIARPMPFEDTIAWYHKHEQKLQQAALRTRRIG